MGEVEQEEDVDWQVQLTFSFPHLSVPTLFGRERGLPHLAFFFLLFFPSLLPFSLFLITKQKEKGNWNFPTLVALFFFVLFSHARARAKLIRTFIRKIWLRATLRFCLDRADDVRQPGHFRLVNGRLAVNNLFNIEINRIKHLINEPPRADVAMF